MVVLLLLGIKPVLRYKVAVCSVACLEWDGRIMDQIEARRAHELRLLPYEILFAKEARYWLGL